MHGNMTGVEKQMNKDDLIAWKNYDNKQYSLIPGISVQKNIMERENKNNMNPSGSVNNLSRSLLDNNKFQERQDMMKQYGFTRDPRDAFS